MMKSNIKYIRQLNLRSILNEQCEGKITGLVGITGISSSQISRYFTENEKHLQKISNATARKIEKSAGKPIGWLDDNHSGLNKAGDAPECWGLLTAKEQNETAIFIGYLIHKRDRGQL